MTRRRKILVALTALVALAVVAIWLHRWKLKSDWEHYRAALVAQGELLTYDALLARREFPASNSAPLFRRALVHFANAGSAGSNNPAAMRMIAPGKAMPGWKPDQIVSSRYATNTWEELAAELERMAPALELLAELSEHPELDFGLDYRQAERLLLPHLAPLKQAARILTGAALLEMRRGNTAAAVQHIRVMLALAQGTENEPLLITQLVRIAIFAFATGAVWNLLQCDQVADENLELLKADLAKARFLEPMLASLEFERAMGDLIIQRLRTEGGLSQAFDFSGRMGGALAPNNPGEEFLHQAKKLVSPDHARRQLGELAWRSSLSFADQKRGMQGTQIAIETLRLIATNHAYLPTLRQSSNAMHALLAPARGTEEEARLFGENLTISEIRRAMVDRMSFVKALQKLPPTEASRNLAITAIALKQYQRRHGHYPETLAALVPDWLMHIPRDPVDGKPLRYRRNDDGGIRLYSIGLDGKDEGGDPRPESPASAAKAWQRGRDWVWPQPATAGEMAAFEREEFSQQD